MGPLMKRENTENQKSREKGETVPSASELSGRSKKALKVTEGTGRARGMNIWYPNVGVASSGEEGDCKDDKD